MERNNAVRVLLALASLPIAVAANSLRVVVTGLLVQYWDPHKAQGFFHEFQGWLMLSHRWPCFTSCIESFV